MRKTPRSFLAPLQGWFIIGAIVIVVVLLWNNPIGRAVLLWFNQLGRWAGD